MGRQRPAAVTNALRVQWALVGVGAVSAVLAVLLRDDLLMSWIESNPAAKAHVDAGGLEALEASSISIPAFGPVVVVSVIVYASLAWVIGAMFRAGHRWARWSLLGLAVSLLFAAYLAAQASLTVPFVVLGAVAVVLDLVLVWLLLRRDCGEWVRGSELAEEHEHTA